MRRCGRVPRSKAQREWGPQRADAGNTGPDTTSIATSRLVASGVIGRCCAPRRAWPSYFDIEVRLLTACRVDVCVTERMVSAAGNVVANANV